jgi:Flp pilus assembly pilin Flp
MPNDALAAFRQLEIGVRAQEGRELRLHRLLDQPLRARVQDFGERVVDFVFLAEGNNFILGHGITLLLGGSGRLDTNPVTPPSSPRHHPLSRIAPTAVAYALIASLISIAAIAAVSSVGNKMSRTFGDVASQLNTQIPAAAV